MLFRSVRVSTFPTDGQDDRFQVLAAIDWQNVVRFASEIPLGPESLIIADPSQGEPPEAFLKTGARHVQLPLKDIAKKIEGGWPNMVALGLLAGLMGLPESAVEKAIARAMKKGKDAALASARAGLEQAKALEGYPLAPPPAKSKRWLITGNEAAGLGALKGGVRFVATYPITPATELLEYMAPALTKLGGQLVQAEDELASINMVLGEIGRAHV